MAGPRAVAFSWLTAEEALRPADIKTARAPETKGAAIEVPEDRPYPPLL